MRRRRLTSDPKEGRSITLFLYSRNRIPREWHCLVTHKHRSEQEDEDLLVNRAIYNVIIANNI